MERRHLAECGSTNTEALAHLRDGGGPLLVSASRQTAGRGRLGRAWLTDHAGDDASLTFSVALPMSAGLDLSGLSLAIGCTVADVLDPAGERIRLKWPNDLFLDGAKLGGILIETVPLPDQRRGVVIGIGLNLRPLPPEADRSAFTSGHAALQALDPAATASATLDRLAPVLRATLADFETLGFAPWQAAFARRDLAAGRRVRVGEQTGIAHGVSPRGELLLATTAGILPMSGGELSLRLETSL
ncbi:BirA family biotin operon repressor/biotin-[acetyl-CoA-carboxylase] ligase [Pelomonas aquatica]|uniref:BirA family biotin operon repressor/biotin-[acetyl-CoA-carboxylase] ligase n=1 Tax=Pelomonas aquatica TaxID=431058 RepID=A0ABU1ZD49_9BURK|nr:biotin--[acetyl-CoA-carboxylase] ligase [Pelomonas aquatica]MDR7298542.1 BirA family biotin operon repressor/biotin-[acetyl-CoA-carboxylase] ligase [Pelomonas aquatica]